MALQQTNDGAITDNVIQLLNILKQRGLGSKIDPIEASKLRNDIISTSKDDSAKLNRPKRGLMDQVKNGYRWLRGLIRRLNTEENRELLIKEGTPLLVEKVHESVHEPDTSEDWIEKILDTLGAFDAFSNLGPSLDYNFEKKDEEALCLAAKQGRLDRVKYLIEYRVSVNARDDNGYTPLHAAAYGGYLDVIKYLIEKGADVNADNNGYTPLHTAANTDHLDVVKYLIDRGADVNAKSDSGRTPLHNASISLSGGSLDIVKYLIERGADPKATDRDGKTPMQRANEEGLSDIVEYLAEIMQQVTEVPQVNEDYSNTSLHLAAEQGNLNAVKYFVEKGTDIDAKNERGKTPLHLAAKQSNLDIVKYLVEKEVDVNAKDRNGNTPLHIAARRGLLDIAKFLLEKEADVDAQENKFGRAPLHLAAVNGHLDIVKYLIEKGANPKATDSDGKTPLQRAAQKGHLDIVEYLKGKGQQVTERQQTMEEHQTTERQQVTTEGPLITERQNITEMPRVTDKYCTADGYKYESLHSAAAQGDLGMVKYFVEEKRIYVSEEDIYGNTPLHLAARCGHLDILEYLMGKNPYIYSRNNGGYNALHLAVEKNQLDVVEYLVEKTNLMTYVTDYGYTPLHIAAQNGYLDVVEYLVKQGADLNARNVYRDAPLYLAAEKGHLDVVKYLIESMVDINVRKWQCNSALLISAVYGNLDIVKYLIENGTDINAKVSNDNTALHNAVLNSHLDVVRYLVEKGADVNAKNYNNETPLDLAEKQIVFEFLSSYQHGSRSRRDVSNNSWINNGIVNWVKGSISKESPDLLTSREQNNYTVTAVPEINTTVVNNTIILGILTAGLFNKTQHKQLINENLLSPREQSMRLNNIDDKGGATSGTSKPSSWINDLCGWVKEKSEVVVSNVVNGLYRDTAKELKGYKSRNIQTGSKKSEKLSSATLLNVSPSGKSAVQGISKENVSNKGWSSSQRKVEGSKNFGAALPKGVSSTASSISQVHAQPDITGLMLLVSIFMDKMGRKFVLPLLSADQPISPEKAQVYASNITNGFTEVLAQQATLKDGIGVHRFKIDFMKMQEEITGKIIGCKFNQISGILKSYTEKACPGRKAGCSGRLSQKKFDKFMTEFNSIIDPVINQSMQQMLSRLEVSDVKEQQISLKPKSYLNGTSVQGYLTQDRDLKKQVIPELLNSSWKRPNNSINRHADLKRILTLSSKK